MNAPPTGTSTIDRRSLEIRELLRDFGVDLDESFHDDASLIGSGLLDSLALFQLVLWVEGKIGRAIDPGTVDLAREWDSICLVLQYIDRSTLDLAPAVPPAPKRTPALGREGEIEIVAYTPAYKQAVAELQTGLWSTDRDLNRRYLEWKYEENPLGIEPHIFLAIARGELIGMRGFYGSRWTAGEPAADFEVLVADDLIVHEHHRNRSVVHQVMRAALDDLNARGESFVFNLSGGAVTVVASLAMGWRSAGPLGLIQRVRRRKFPPVIHRRVERDPFLRLDGLASSIVTSHGIRVQVSREPDVDRMAQLVGRLPRDARIRHVRDAAYLAWCFRNPLHTYRFLSVGDDAIDGYLVLKHGNRSNPRVSIVDLEAGEGPTREALLEAAIRPGLIDHLEAWSASLDWASQDDLSRAGFEPAAGDRSLHGVPCILVRPTGDSRPEDQWHLNGVPLLDMRHWNMRMIDSMAG